MTKVYIVGGGNEQYRQLIKGFGMELTTSPEYADLGLFTGGEDVTPSLYGAFPHPMTHSNIQRDESERMYFDAFKEFGTPMIGICRGGQFLNVMSGGEMYQHVTHHTNDHVIMDVLSQNTLWASSTHHQMMKPSVKGLVVATAYERGRRQWFDRDVFMQGWSDEDIEVVYYEHTKCLCFQPHPEFSGERYNHMRDYLKELFTRFDMVQYEKVAA